METQDRPTVYLEIDDILGLYADLFDCTDQEAADQLRSRPVLEGAIGRPRQHAHYGGADLALQAAVLAHGIAEGQPIVDGNKRTALASLRTFLLANGFGVNASQETRAAWMLRLSEGATEDDLAGWIRQALVPAANG
jgi:death-on-curing protein